MTKSRFKPAFGSYRYDISFKDFNKSIKHPFVIYADFETILEKIDTVSPNPNKSSINKYQKHTPCGFCYYIKSSAGDEYNKNFIEEKMPQMSLKDDWKKTA